MPFQEDEREDEVVGMLRNIGSTDSAYPSDLYAARRDEFISNVQDTKRSGCRSAMILMSSATIGLVILTIILIVAAVAIGGT